MWLGKLIEHVLEELADHERRARRCWASQSGLTLTLTLTLEVTLDPWQIVVRSEDGAQALLRDKCCTTKQKSKKKVRKVRGSFSGQRSHTSSTSPPLSSAFLGQSFRPLTQGHEGCTGKKHTFHGGLATHL